MHNEDQSVIISWHDYFANARDTFLKECCKSEEEIAVAEENAAASAEHFVVLHLNTSGENDVIAQYPGYKSLLKSVFLSRPDFRTNVIGYYRQFGYTWVDIVALKRDQWKIFLWKPLHH